MRNALCWGRVKILIAPDKFKGSLSALEAATALARGFARIYPDASIEQIPMADGGEGTARAICTALDGEWLTCDVRDPHGSPITAGYAWVAETATAAIEMSEASGFSRVPAEKRKPGWVRKANTYGTGQLIRDAMRRGAKRIIVGLGGSATTDGGAGMAAALGYEFLTSDGELMEQPAPCNLLALERIELNEVIEWPEIIAACDVQNPLLGPEGTARVFAPQKGADASDVQAMEWALEHLAELATRDLELEHGFQETPGAGAAGGLGFGLMTFCHAKMRSGFVLVSEILKLEESIADSDLVVTGEGSLDAQTLQGKGPAGVAALAHKHGKPVIAFGGRISDEPQLHALFDFIVPIAGSSVSSEYSMTHAAELLEESVLTWRAQINLLVPKS